MHSITYFPLVQSESFVLQSYSQQPLSSWKRARDGLTSSDSPKLSNAVDDKAWFSLLPSYIILNVSTGINPRKNQ